MSHGYELILVGLCIYATVNKAIDWFTPSLIQVMVWSLFGIKPLSEAMIIYCDLST